MARDTDVVSLRVDPDTRALLQRRANERGSSLAAFLREIAEDSVGTASHFHRWAQDVERTRDGVRCISETEELLALAPGLENLIGDFEAGLDELLNAVIEEGGLEDDYEAEAGDDDDE